MNPLFFLSRKESETKVANDRLLCYGSALYLLVILFLKDDKEHVAEVERQLKEKRALAQSESITA